MASEQHRGNCYQWSQYYRLVTLAVAFLNLISLTVGSPVFSQHSSHFSHCKYKEHSIMRPQTQLMARAYMVAQEDGHLITSQK